MLIVAFFFVPGWRKYGSGEFDGWLFSPGRFRDISRPSGNGLIYLYPDYETALLGDWANGEMVRGKRVKVKGHR